MKMARSIRERDSLAEPADSTENTENRTCHNFPGLLFYAQMCTTGWNEAEQQRVMISCELLLQASQNYRASSTTVAASFMKHFRRSFNSHEDAITADIC